MRSTARLIHPILTRAHHIAVLQASQLPDPLEKREKRVVDGRVRYTEDIRDTKLRPFIQGAFAAWFPYKLDAVWYQKMEVKAGKYVFEMQLTPSATVGVLSRWLQHWVSDPKRPTALQSPTFDKIFDLIQGFNKEEQE